MSEGANFSATTPSRGRPPTPPGSLRIQKVIFVLFFVAWIKEFAGQCASASEPSNRGRPEGDGQDIVI